MIDALRSLSNSFFYAGTVSRLAKIIAYAHAQSIGHEWPDVYAETHYLRHEPEARAVFAALTCPMIDDARKMRADVMCCKHDRTNIFLSAAQESKEDYKNALGQETVLLYGALKNAGFFDNGPKGFE